jgi:NADPH:quinone reductase-like Zn-dependent oxidoreductase
MRAVRIHKYGNQDVLVMDEMPVPKAEKDEIIVRVKSAGVNPVDWKVREGFLKDRVPHKLPLTLGWDVAGVVTEIGSNVTKFQVGDKIYALPPLNKNGAYADYIAISEQDAALMPKTISFDVAAAVPLAASTAWAALFDDAHLSAGQKILIHAAVGGVGSFAVQFAKQKDCYVYGTVSTNNIELAKNLGVDTVIDYTKQDFSEIVKDVDVVLDTMSGETQQKSFKCLKRGGILVSTLGMPDKKLAEQYGVRILDVQVRPSGARLDQIAQLIDGYKINPLIDAILPFEQFKDAQMRSQGGHAKGKIILKMED